MEASGRLWALWKVELSLLGQGAVKREDAPSLFPPKVYAAAIAKVCFVF
jgi:hypothetical protein